MIATVMRIMMIRNDTRSQFCCLISFGKVKADSAGPDNADNGRRSRIRFEVVEHLTQDDRQHLRNDAKPNLMQRRTSGRGHAVNRLGVGRLDGLREQLAE